MRQHIASAGWFLAGGIVAGACVWFLKPSAPSRAIPQTVEVEKPQQKPVECGPSKAILPPPQFSAKLPPKLETNREGEVRVAWDEVPGAKTYFVYVTDLKGRVIKKYSSPRLSLYLKEIPTPPDVEMVNYKVVLATVNGNDQAGEKSEARDLTVNKHASVVAPTVKQIVVED